MLLALGAAAGTLLWAFIAVRKLARDELRARQRARDLETELNESEAALTAEPHVLIVWRGRHSDPDRIIETIDMETAMLRLFRDLKSDNKGVTMIEYALIAGLISVVAIAMLTAMGTTVNSLFSTINTALTSA